MNNHAYIASIADTHPQPTITRHPGEPITVIGRRFMGEYIYQKVEVRGADESHTMMYVMTAKWEREI